MKSNTLVIFFACFLFSCSILERPTKIVYISNIISYKLKDTLTDLDKDRWYAKDIINDTIPGTSYIKTQSLLKNKTSNKAIVAVLDSEIALQNKIFLNRLWENTEEIPDNGIDDDDNGYIDDTNGWNFLGNSSGKNIINAKYEFVRVIRFFKDKFGNKEIDQIDINSIEDFKYYKKAKERYNSEHKESKSNFEYAHEIFSRYLEAKEGLKSYFPNAVYDIETLNSIDTINNKSLIKHINEIRELIAYKETDQSITCLLYTSPSPRD